MSQSGDERSDAVSNTEPRGETIIDVRQTQPLTNEKHDSESETRVAIFERDDELYYAIYKATNKGDWETAKRIYETHNLSFITPITPERQTALHIAALAGQTQFATELIRERGNSNWLWQPDLNGNTPLVCAVVSGNRALVEVMLQNSKGLEILKSKEFWQKILALTSLGRKDIMTYMYGVCKDLLENDDRAYLLFALIDADMYDLAWDLSTGERFAACRGEYKVDALSALARKPHLANTFPQAPSSIINRYWNLVTSGKTQKNNLHQSAYELAEYIRYRRNLLHMAGEWSPSDYLDVVPGEALKLQRELLWFERVEKFVGPVLAEEKNEVGDSPDGVFKNTHEILIKKAEEWMKKTADSCTIVAALVATVVFAAAFTAPGGNNQNTGFPMFLNAASFKIFIVSDAISLISALASLLTFMSIQTSTYSLKDFVSSLPTKLLTGYSTLFVSIAAMMVTFVTVLFVYFQQYQLLIVALPLALVAVIPIAFFARLHYRLLDSMITFWQQLKYIHD